MRNSLTGIPRLVSPRTLPAPVFMNNSQFLQKLSVDNLRYHISAAAARLSQMPACPACGTTASTMADRKGFHMLNECQECRLLYRYPREAESRAQDFYQSGYSEPGLTTELPGETELKELMQTNFAGSTKDFSYHISVLEALGATAGTRILDFGANWGYSTFQFLRAGFDVEAYEISISRAAYGKNLGVSILTDAREISGDFDIVYSCHVLEHVPNPTRILQQQLAYLRPGGLLVAHTPNGSREFRRKQPECFHRLWGRAHPVLLSDEYIARLFPTNPIYVSSVDAPQVVAQWSRADRRVGTCDDSGLFFVVRLT